MTLAIVPVLSLFPAMLQAPSTPAAAAPPRRSVIPYDVQTTTLGNGLRVIVIPMPSEGLVSYWSVVRTGSRDEVEPGVTGFAHYFEHMMFRGTKSHPDFDKVTIGIGADANAFTTDDYTAYHLSFAKEDLPTVVDLEADRFRNLEYDEAKFKTEAGAVYGEYRKGRTSPVEVLDEAIRNAAFDRHTYKHTTIGFEADIKAMPQQFAYSRTFFKRYYRPENVVVLVTGDVEPGPTLELIRAKYEPWERGYLAPAVPEEPTQTAQRRLEVPFEGKTLPILAVAFKSDRFDPAEKTVQAAMLLADLGFGEASPLYKKLVLEEQRVDRLLPLFDANRDPGLWAVLAWVKDPADVAAVEGEIWMAVDELRRTPVSSARLNEVRSRKKYGFLTELSTPQGVSENLAQYLALTGDVAAVDTMFATLDGVTAEDVRRAAERYLQPQRSTVAVLRGKADAAPAPMDGMSESTVLLPVPKDPNVAFKLWFKVGSQDDPPGKEGLASLTAAMLSEGGTQGRTYPEILDALFPLAASYDASVDKEMTVVSGVVHRDHVARFYSLLKDAVLRPGFRPDDFERLRDRAITGIEKQLRYSSDEELGKATLSTRIFAGTPYGHLDDGSVAALKAITLDDVKAFFAKHYTRENVVVGIGGAYADALPASVQSDVAKLPEGRPATTPESKAAPITGRRLTIVEKPGPSTAISFGCPVGVKRGSREYYALWLANSWLGEHRNSASHLYQVIREARGMNYGDYSYIEAFPRGGRRTMPPTGVGRRSQLFEVWVRPVPEKNTLFALRAALREVEKLSKDGLTPAEFEFTRAFLKKYSYHFAETTEDRLGYAVDDRYYGVNGHLALFRKTMDELTLDEVNAAIRRNIQADDLQIVLVTANASAMQRAIVDDKPSPIDYAGIEKPKEILDEDKEIERYPLRIPAANISIVPVDEMFAR